MLKKLFILAILFFLVAQTPGAFAQFEDSNQVGSNARDAKGASLIDQLNQNLKKQEELRNKISNAKEKEKTLSAEIGQLNGQISQKKLEIEETEIRLEQLAVDIGDVTGKLEETKKDLDYTTQVANSRLRSIYKQSYTGPMESFLGTVSFNNFFTKQKYTEAIRQQDVTLLEELESLKKNFGDQKASLESKQKKEQALEDKLGNQRASLSNQQGSKQYVLGVTKNNEQQYQRLLAQVQGEIAAIARALGGGGVRLGPVKKGDVVAFQGNTGCSTGSHVHFGLYINGSAVNPKPYLDSGALRWPESNPTVTQWFGANYWWYMNNFGLPGHTGIDMAEYHGAPILAAADGIAYLSSDSSACWLTGTIGKGIRIEHYNGWNTIYWHIQ